MKVAVKNTDNKFIIIGRSFLNIHIPQQQDPIAMRSVTYYLVVNESTIAFVGSSGKSFKLRNLVDATATANAIVRAIEKNKSNLNLFTKFFVQSLVEYVLPSIEEAFVTLSKEPVYQKFNTHVGLLKKERTSLLKGEIPVRLHTVTFAFACAVILGKPKTCSMPSKVFWVKLLKNEEDSRTAETV